MTTPNKTQSKTPSSTAETLRPTFDEANDALSDLQVLECALQATTDENAPLDAPTRQAALARAADLLHARIATLEQALDTLEDHVATRFGNGN